MRLTKQDSKEIEQAVARTIVLRYSWRESLHYTKDQTSFSITEQGHYKVKNRLKGKGREWVHKMQQDQDSFLSEYRQRYEEMIQTQRDPQYIAISNPRSQLRIDPRQSYFRILDSLCLHLLVH